MSRTIRPDARLVQEFTYQQEKLPVDKPIGLYIRQSSSAQIGNSSTGMQEDDMPAMLQKMGWPESLIIKFDQDTGTSGTLLTVDREGMQKLFKAIRRKE